MIDLVGINLRVIIAFSLMTVVALLAYIAFFKKDIDQYLKSISKRSS